MRQKCGVKKGQSIYWFSGFKPGSTSLRYEVTALTTVTTQAETDAHRARWTVHHHPPPSMASVKVVVDVLGKRWMMHRFTLVQTRCITTQHPLWLNPSTFSWPLKRMKSGGRLTKTGNTGQWRAFVDSGQRKGNNVNSEHREDGLEALHQEQLTSKCFTRIPKQTTVGSFWL